MQLLFPWGLLALVLVPVLFLIHMLRLPGRPAPVSYLPLWDKVISRTAALRTRPQRRLDLLFLLETAVVLLLSLSLAQTAGRWGSSPRRIALVMDLGASMQAKLPSDGTRWDRARSTADGLLRTLARTDRVTLVRCFGTERAESTVLFPDEVRRLLAQSSPCDAPATGEEISSTWVATLDKEHDAVFFITDSLETGLARTLPPASRCVTVGEPVENLGLTHWSSRTTDAGTQVFVRVLNAGTRPHAGSVVLLGVAGLLKDQTFQLPSGQSQDLVFTLSGDPGPWLETQIITPEGPDAFPLDDRVEAARMRLSVAVAGPASPDVNRFFSRLFPDTAAVMELPNPARLSAGQSPDLVVTDGVGPLENVDGASLAFSPHGDRAGDAVLGSERDAPQGRKVIGHNDILLESVGLDGLRVKRYRPLSALTGGARPLLSMGTDVIAAVTRTADGPKVVFGFGLSDSRWTEDPSFVVFMINFLREVTGTGQPPDAPYVVLPTGTYVRRPSATSATGRGWSVEPVLSVGKVTVGKGPRELRAALLSPSESRLPAERLKTARLVLPESARRLAWNPITPFLVALAAAGLFLWWVWPR